MRIENGSTLNGVRFRRVVPVLGFFISLFLGGCQMGYVTKSVYYQLELLSYRVDTQEVLEKGLLGAGKRERLKFVETLRKYAHREGLETRESYSTLALNWPRELFNISAAPEDSFRPITWNFPIVGTVPYLGFFNRKDSFPILRDLQERKLDIYARPVRAYSTLGWFDDPILPPMLSWPDFPLMRTVFHELSHATLWLPGSVRFNESFASFMGEQMALNYLEERYGKESSQWKEATQYLADSARYEAALLQLYTELEGVYTSGLSREEKLREKRRLYATLPSRVKALQFHGPEPYLASARSKTWNNARLMQFRAYNDLKGLFARAYRLQGSTISLLLEFLKNADLSQDDPERDLRTLLNRIEENKGPLKRIQKP